MLFRKPRLTDGVALHRLIASCPPLDTNSVYCNLLQTLHFAGTGVAAELDGELVGFISGYLIPDREQELFVWQVAVAPSCRGKGLALSMLNWLVDETKPRALETTITPDNADSWALFRALADKRDAIFTDAGIYFDSETIFNGEHDSEHLVRISARLLEAQI